MPKNVQSSKNILQAMIYTDGDNLFYWMGTSQDCSLMSKFKFKTKAKARQNLKNFAQSFNLDLKLGLIEKN